MLEIIRIILIVIVFIPVIIYFVKISKQDYDLYELKIDNEKKINRLFDLLIEKYENE